MSDWWLLLLWPISGWALGFWAEIGEHDLTVARAFGVAVVGALFGAPGIMLVGAILWLHENRNAVLLRKRP